MSATTGSARFSPEVIARGREIFNALKSARRVLVTSEPYPDGDAFGTELALDHVCRHAFAVAGNPDARVYLVNEKGCPRKYRFMSGSEKIRKLDAVFEEELARERERVEDRRGPAEAQRRWDFDVGIVVDGGAERAGPAAKELFDRCKTRIIIDHHKFGSREKYDISLTDIAASSTTQIVWTFFADPEIAVPVTREAAEAIYLGLIYDTGSFQYSNTKPLTHEIAARLMDAGVDVARIHEKALLTQEFEEMQVIGRVLAGAQRSGHAGEIVHASVSHEFMREMKVSGDEFNRIIQTLCFLEGIEVAIIFRETTGDPGFAVAGAPPDARTWKLSLRSRGKVDVAAIARELDPQGGGHDRAAGCSLAGEIDEVRAKAIDHVAKKLAAARAGAK